MKPATLMATALAAILALGACAPQASNTASKAPVAQATLDGTERKTARGTFTGKSNHVTTGHGSIARVGKQWVVILEGDFTFDGAPDPKVALGAGGFRKDAILSPLQANAGEQVYVIPAGLDVANFNEIWIWCEEFNVPLGVASLTLT